MSWIKRIWRKKKAVKDILKTKYGHVAYKEEKGESEKKKEEEKKEEEREEIKEYQSKIRRPHYHWEFWECEWVEEAKKWKELEGKVALFKDYTHENYMRDFYVVKVTPSGKFMFVLLRRIHSMEYLPMWFVNHEYPYFSVWHESHYTFKIEDVFELDERPETTEELKETIEIMKKWGRYL